MAGVMKNLVYRMSISAIVGALVASGIIYLSQDGVARSLQTEMRAQRAAQITEQQALIETLNEVRGEVAAMHTANATAIAGLSAKVDAMIGTVETHIEQSDHANYEEHDTALETFSRDVYQTLDEIKATLADMTIATPIPVEEE